MGTTNPTTYRTWRSKNELNGYRPEADFNGRESEIEMLIASIFTKNARIITIMPRI
jgi:hypothetical protein